MKQGIFYIAATTVYVALQIVKLVSNARWVPAKDGYYSRTEGLVDDKKRLDMNKEQQAEYDRQVAELRRELNRVQTRYDNAPDDKKAELLMEKVQLLEKLDELLCRSQIL